MKRTARERRTKRKVGEAQHQRTRRAARAAAALPPAQPSGWSGPAPEVQARGTVLNPGDPGWIPAQKFLDAHPGWRPDKQGNWHPPTEGTS